MVVKCYWEQCATVDAGSGLISERVLVIKSEDLGREVSFNMADGKQGLETGGRGVETWADSTKY